MRYIKSYIMFALMAFAFTGCKMDDLKDDVNDLKDRVTSLEQQINILNENLEVISYLFDEKLVITSCTPNGTAPDYDSYTIIFSDNSEMTLNLGSQSSVRLPNMKIVDGKWVIEDLPTDIPVSNDVTGDNGMVPKFKLELDAEVNKYYWTVLYDGGSINEEVKDVNGNRVYVTSDTLLPEDPYFISAGLSEDGKYFELKLVESSETLRQIPIVSDLKCELSEIYSQYDGKWTFGKSATQTVKLKVSGDDILVYAPTGWTYSIGEKDESGVVAISVTAPAADGVGTRLSANNKEDLSVMVRKDNYWAVWKTKVGLVSGGKYNKFDTNGTITIDDETISKTDDIFYYRIGDPDYQVTQPGVYFLAKGLKWNANIKSDIDGNLYFIDESDEGRTATVNVAKQLSFSAADNLYFSDVIFDASATTNSKGELQYPIAIGVNNHHLENLVFYNSVISIVPTKSVAYMGNVTRWIVNTKIKNSDFICDGNAENQQFTLIGISSYQCFEYQKIELVDNVFYSNTPEFKPQFVAFNGNSGGVTEFIMTNNTFVNVVLGQNGLLNIGTLNKFTTQNNIFWYDYSLTGNQFIINAKTGPSEGQYDNNYVYCSATNKVWNIFKDGSTVSLVGEEFSIIDSDPFEGGQFDIASGIFVPNSEYSSYGASQRN